MHFIYLKYSRNSRVSRSMRSTGDDVWVSCNSTTCWKIVELQDDNKLLEQFVTSLLSLTALYRLAASCQQTVDNLSTSLEQAVRTHPDDKLSEQH
jgi:hypothetical protein